MPKTTKKPQSTKPAKKKSTKSSQAAMPQVEPMLESTQTVVAPKPASMPKSKVSSRVLSLALIVLAIALLTYKAGPYLVPAIVGTTPVTRFQVWNRLEQSYGSQTLDDLVNEKILDDAIAKSGVKVDQSKVDDQLKQLEDRFQSTGGLDAVLTQQGMTKDELTKQIKTQLAVEEILKDKITPTDEEVKKAFDDDATTTYKDKKFDDVKDQVKDTLTQTKLVSAFRDWFDQVKKDAKVKNFGL